MYKVQPFLVSVLCVLPLFACQKSDPLEGCLGCGADTSVRAFTFRIEGDLIGSCQGGAASHKLLEMTVFYKQDTLVVTGQTDASGHFQLSYKKMLPGYYQHSVNAEAHTLLSVPEDSVTYFFRGLANSPKLRLQSRDSLDLKVYLDFANQPLKATDTLVYSFFRYRQKVPPASVFKAGGPLPNHALLQTVKDKWRFVEIDDQGNPVLKMYWYIVRGNGFTSSDAFHATASKVPCVMKQDSVRINLN